MRHHHRRRPAVFAMLLAASVVLLTWNSASHAGRPSGAGGGGKGLIYLVGNDVIPGPGASGGVVTAEIAFSRNQICFDFKVVSLPGNITHIGIYKATINMTGPEVVVLVPMPSGEMGLRGCVPVSRELSTAISRNKSDYYVMITTDVHPGGAVRAQLGH